MISLPEAIHTGIDLVHLADDVAAKDKDGGPLLDEDGGVLHVTVERVDGDGKRFSQRRLWAMQRRRLPEGCRRSEAMRLDSLIPTYSRASFWSAWV